MEKLTINFGKDSKSKKQKTSIVSMLERKGIAFNLKTDKVDDNRCGKCGNDSFNNYDCDECIKNSVGEVFAE